MILQMSRETGILRRLVAAGGLLEEEPTVHEVVHGLITRVTSMKKIPSEDGI